LSIKKYFRIIIPAEPAEVISLFDQIVDILQRITAFDVASPEAKIIPGDHV